MAPRVAAVRLTATAPRTAPAAIVAAAPESTAVADQDTRRQVLFHHFDGQLILDPLAQSARNTFPLGEIYAGLVRAPNDLAGDPAPDLAASWAVSSDGFQYTFTLRDGLRFSDGASLTAADVKWSWERALRPEYATHEASLVFGAIVGAAAMLDGTASSLTGVNVVDEETLQIDLIRPQAHFVHLLADPSATVLREQNFDNWGTLNWVGYDRTNTSGFLESFEFLELPVGAGPFRIVEYEYPNLAKLEPNPHRWSGAPDVDEIEVLHRSYGAGNRPRRLSADETDFRRTWRETFDAGGPKDAGFDGHIFAAAPPVTFLALNTAIPPFDDVEFRRALLHAANRSVPQVIGLPEQSANGLLPPGFVGHVEAEPYVEPGVEAASRHLANSPYAGGGYDALQLLDNTPALNPHFLRFFSDAWTADLGIEIATWTPGISDPPQGIPPEVLYAEALADGTLQMRYVHVEPRYPDPCAILCRIPDLFGPNALSDETEQLREMLHDAAATADRAARIAKYQAIEAHILDRALVIPAYWDDGTVYEVVRPYISGYKVPAYGGSRYEDVVVDTTHPDYPVGR